ncbi:MAG: HAMP domain-containing sensor histidine kinase [bacterium]
MIGDIQSNKLLVLGKLAASLAHEIRNPLSALMLNLDYLTLSKEELNSEILDSVKACKEAAERIQILMENTLDFSRRSNKEINYHSIKDILEQATSLIEGEAKLKNISISLIYNEPIPHIDVDKNKILQVFVNLIHNAIEASFMNNKVEVKVGLNTNNDILLEIEDYGVGIKEEDKVKIFSDFYTNKAHGTGLGLVVCKMLLEEFNAKLDFESVEGKGSKFFIIFPHKKNEDNE